MGEDARLRELPIKLASFRAVNLVADPDLGNGQGAAVALSTNVSPWTQ
jgi:hypothetical protein